MKFITEDQKLSYFEKSSIGREKELSWESDRIAIISGVRRCGKSTLIKNEFLRNETGLYINFEDPRLSSFEQSDFLRLEALMREEGKERLLLDEVQIIPGWELYARSAHERGIKLVITGSNSSLLSRELGTKLTGRYIQYELFPFSYSEFLTYYRKERSKESFDEYFECGGFPEYLDTRDENYLRLLLRDIVARDIAQRRNISNENQLMRLAVQLLSNVGNEFSFNRTARLLEIKSVRTVIDYCDYLSDSYVVEYVPMYSTSIRKQIANAKKAYAVDPVFAVANSLSFSRDTGRRLENFIYLKLRREGGEIFYYKTVDSECDFLIKDRNEITQVIQVCQELTRENLERELRGIRSAMKETGTNNGLILTLNQEDNLDGISVLPVWKWI